MVTRVKSTVFNLNLWLHLILFSVLCSLFSPAFHPFLQVRLRMERTQHGEATRGLGLQAKHLSLSHPKMRRRLLSLLLAPKDDMAGLGRVPAFPAAEMEASTAAPAALLAEVQLQAEVRDLVADCSSASTLSIVLVCAMFFFNPLTLIHQGAVHSLCSLPRCLPATRWSKA